MKDHDISKIPYGLDLEVFMPSNPERSRKKFNLPLNRKLILFGAVAATSDPRKGFDLLLQSISELNNSNLDADLVVFGAGKPSQAPDFGRPVHYLGEINDESRLASLYSSVDVMVAPSRQDNLPNTVLESLACGTPVAAFEIGGMADMIDHQQNGWLAAPFETKQLASGIKWVLEHPGRRREMSREARRTAERFFPMELSVERYRELYKRLLAG
jgi:glycosyltransferase involved in cell wall biosynthesis